jgi:hypothetical protein
MSPLELTLLVIFVLLLALLSGLYLAPLELKGELRRDGPRSGPEPAYPRRESGGGLAGEVELRLGLVSLQAVPCSTRSVQLVLRVGGLRLARWETALRREHAPREEQAPAEAEKRSPGEASPGPLARARRHWDLRELLRFVFDQRHLLVFGPLEGRVDFGFEDPALTGEVFGYVCAAREVSPGLAGVELNPLWSFENGCWGWLRGRVEARLFALGLALALHLVTHYRRDRAASAQRSGMAGGARSA